VDKSLREAEGHGTIDRIQGNGFSSPTFYPTSSLHPPENTTSLQALSAGLLALHAYFSLRRPRCVPNWPPEVGGRWPSRLVA